VILDMGAVMAIAMILVAVTTLALFTAMVAWLTQD
jgi:hypothetical protein